MLSSCTIPSSLLLSLRAPEWIDRQFLGFLSEMQFDMTFLPEFWTSGFSKLISEFNGFSEKRKTAYGGFQSALHSFNVPLIGKPCCTYCFTGGNQHLMFLNQEQHKGKGRCSNKWYLYRIATCRTELRHFKMWSLQLWSSATSSRNWPPW